MNRLIPHCVPTELWRGAPDSRLASRIHADSHEGCSIALIGFADDLGVQLNNGRPGAAGGPDAIRNSLLRYGVAEPAGWVYPAIFDAGNIIPAPGKTEQSLHETHARVTEATRELLSLGMFPIGLGGGHDLTYPFVRAVIEHHTRSPRPVRRGVYFDAHLDVRETAGSGMPFRRLIETCSINELFIIGANGLANSDTHTQWFCANGGKFAESSVTIFSEFSPLSDLFVSLDLDVFDASSAPGVSAMNPCGLPPRALQEQLTLAGACPHVACFDIMELCPVFDHEYRTARVAAHMLLSFLKGYAQREHRSQRP